MLDFTVYTDPAGLPSTGFVEIGPGPYAGKHWQPGWTFVWDDAFALATGVVRHHFVEYDGFAMNDLPADAARAIAQDLRAAVDALPSLDALRVSESARAWLEGDVRAQPDAARAMLRAVADALDTAAAHGPVVCILGM